MFPMAMQENQGLVARALGILILAVIAIETPRATATGGDNPMAQNVPTQLQLLKHHGEPLGYWLGSSTTPTIGGHINGMARSDGPDGTPYLYVAHAEGGGEIVVVRMASRDVDGERLRSNRLRRYSHSWQTPPPSEDVVVEVIEFSVADFLGSGVPMTYSHPGGMQILDDVLVVALQDPASSAAADAALAVIDVADPLNPQLLELKTVADTTADDIEGSGASAIVRIEDGTYLITSMLKIAGKDEKTLIAWQTPTDDLRDLANPGVDLIEIDRWRASELSEFGDDEGDWEGGPTTFGLNWPFQALSFVKETPAGNDPPRMYLLAFRNSTGSPSDGDDWIHIYEVFLIGGQLKLDFLDKRKFYRDTTQDQMGDFSAAAGAYVTPSGQLIVYSAEYSNGGPSGTVRFGEWSHYGRTEDMIGQFGDAWFELYDNDNGWTDDNQSMSLVFDACDKDLENLEDLRQHDNFDDRVSSIVWRLPVGESIVLYEHPFFQGASLVLQGNGEVQFLADLEASFIDNDPFEELVSEWGDRIESVRFAGSCVGQAVAVPEVRLTLTDGIAAIANIPSTCSTVSILAGPQIVAGGILENPVAQPIRLEPRGGAVVILGP
ncbi:MAG: hypothetical protein H6819_05865 [Phycisphaerales bacterium]|nr:hypothetical protein [Phycisphaerales bacterium]MCB9858653.1 hypothetical protein [Phycisphaerales bacterium]